MKKILVILLCTALLLPLFGCSGKSTGSRGENDLWTEASPETSAMQLFVFDDAGSRSLIIFDQSDEHAILDRLSAVDAAPVTDWTAKQVKLPVYGLEIGSADGWGIRAAWSDGYLILRDGSVYEFDLDFAALERDYRWELQDRLLPSISAMPCGRLLSEGSDGWIADRLFPSGELTPPEGITMKRKEQTADSVTVELTNSGRTEWTYGEYFTLQALLDGVWYEVPVLDDKNYGFTSIGIQLAAGETAEKTYSLTTYGDLPAGDYRLVMSDLSAEFSVD